MSQDHNQVRRPVDPYVARAHGTPAVSRACELTITADYGGSNGVRMRLWKLDLQKLPDETGLVLNVHHYPPGTIAARFHIIWFCSQILWSKQAVDACSPKGG